MVGGVTVALDLSILDGEAGFLPSRAGVAPRAVLSLFEEDPGNPRFEEDPHEFALLVADVRARGILQPVIVRRLESGRLRIRFGARRYRAAVAAGLADAPYVVTEDERQFDDYSQVAENEHRSSLQPLELAKFAARKIAEGDRKQVVARRIGLHPTALTHLLCLAGDVPPFLLELYHARKCRTPVYLYRLLRLWHHDPQRVEAICSEAVEVGAALVDALERVTEAPTAGASTPPEEAGTMRVSMVPTVATQFGESIHDDTPPGNDDAPPAVTPTEGLTRPRLFGAWQGREVLLLLRRRPSRKDLIVVRCCDGLEELEVPIGEIVLSSLVNGNRKRIP